MNFLRKHNQGFTIAETLIMVAIISVISISIGVFQSDIFRKEKIARSRILATEQHRIALRRFVEEARNISMSSTGTYPILTADSNAFTFYADTDNDNLKERIRYYIENGNLKKAVMKPVGSPVTYTGTEKISSVVSSIASSSIQVFTYYDTNGVALSNPATVSSIRSVQMKVSSVILDSNGIATTTVAQETRATLRNLKDNY